MTGRKVTFELPVRTFQIDINRHVSNIVYIQWLEVGRTRILEAAGMPIESLHEQGYHPVLVETWIQYREPIFYPDTVRVEAWVHDLTRVSAWMSFRLFSGRTGRLVTRAKQRGVFVTADTNKPYRLQDRDRRGFEAVYVPSESA